MANSRHNLYYEIHGDGSPLIFLNGIMMSTSSWNEHIKILEKYFKVIVYDMRDQGRSFRADESYSIEVHVEDLYNLIEELNLEKVNLAGLSYGGQVAQLFALKYPEKIDKLILANTISHVDNYLKAIGQSWKAAAKTYDGETFFDIALPPIYSKFFYDEPASYEWLMKRRNFFKESLDKNWFDGFIRLASSNESFDVRNRLSEISIPTFLIAGDEDMITSYDEMFFIHKKINKSQFVSIPETGHCLFLEKLNLFCNLIKGFLL